MLLWIIKWFGIYNCVIGPRIEPGGTLQFASRSFDSTSCITVYCVLPVK